MAINIELAVKAEREARRICRERGLPEALWHMVLIEAYDRITAYADHHDKSENDGERDAGRRPPCPRHGHVGQPVRQGSVFRGAPHRPRRGG